MNIQIHDAKTGKLETEKVFQVEKMRALYGTPLGRKLADHLLSRRGFCRLYGLYYDSSLSRRDIAPFITRYGISMAEFESANYFSFNDFFVRKFKSGARSWEQAPKTMPAFCEGRFLGYERSAEDSRYQVKGREVSVPGLIAHPKWEKTFLGGPVLVGRLAPVDYHRFHFPDSGRIVDRYRAHGRFHSVSPIALGYRHDILWTNERRISILETGNFGKLAYIEVGALAVGRIVETHGNREFTRGGEKGYFQFGGSTVVVIGEPGRWKPDALILDNTANGIETRVELGARLASAT